MIKAMGLTKKFDKVTAVDDLSFSVGRGVIYGLLGSNGAGKTTALRMLATMLKPTSGTAEIDGFDILKNPKEVRERTGLLFGGDTGLYDRLTARENIMYFAELNDVPSGEAEKRISEFAEMFNFGEFLNKAAGKLSKGTRQKISFARAIIHRPAVMLFDEPALGLDVTAKKEVENFIMHCRSEDNMIILSDHSLEMVERLCDTVGILEKGRLIGEGTIPELCEKRGAKNLEEVFFGWVGEKGKQ